MSGRPIDPTTGEIDWNEVRARVANAFNPDVDDGAMERARAVLAERARRLAVAAERTEPAVETLEVLPFRLGREHYALETRYVREVVRLSGFTSIPGAVDFLLGVTNLRGEIVPIFDLMRLFGFSSEGLLDRSRVIMTGAAEVEFGIIADTVQPVARVPAAAIGADTGFDGKRGGECVRGVTSDAMIVLDGAMLIADRRLFIGASEVAGEAGR